MSYIRVRPRSHKRRKEITDSDIALIESGPIPVTEINTFLEEKPNATHSEQIESLIGGQFIPDFIDNGPNLINTSSEKMAEYDKQRLVIEQIRAVKKMKTNRYLLHQTVNTRSYYPSEPFFTVLVKVISNHKPSKEDIYDNLKHLGTIEDVVLSNDGHDFHFAFVRFESSEVALDLSQNANQLKLNYGLAKNVSIQAFAKRPICCTGGYEVLAVMRPIDKQLFVQEVQKTIKSGTHFDSIKTLLLLTETERQNRLQLINKLETIVNNNGIDCKFHAFGSTLNELGFCDSDIDIFIEIYDQNNLRERLDSDIAIRYLDLIRETLVKGLRMYIKPTITSRRCPIVKIDFRHFGDTLRENGIECDLSLVCSLGIHNSKLIAFYCHLEPQFHTLAVVLRYLAKTNGFIGSSRMSSYAFSMLIIFFAQNLSVPLLPTVDKLMQMKTEGLVINQFEVGFCDDVNRYRQEFPNQWNHSTTNHLFELFFKFYSEFEFEKYVICPRIGKIIKKTAFDYHLRKRNVRNSHEFQMTSLICIEDPFDPTFNITHHMPYKLFLHLKSWFSRVYALSDQYFNNDITDNPNVKTFVDFLEPTLPYETPIREIREQIANDNKNEVEVIEICDEKEEMDTKVVERIPFKHLIGKLTTNFSSNIYKREVKEYLENWGLKVGQFFKLLFRDGFGMKCFYQNKSQSVVKFNEISIFDSFILKFSTSQRRVIDMNVRQTAENEMRQLPQLPQHIDFIRRQTLITEAVVKNNDFCLIIDEKSVDIELIVDLSLEPNKKIYLSVTDAKPKNSTQTKRFIDFVCQTFRTGLEAEELLVIDDNIKVI